MIAEVTQLRRESEEGSCRGLLQSQVKLASLTTWRVGGPAERLFRPEDRDDLLRFLALLPEDEPLTFLGLGSNVLVRDGGVPGTVILTAGRLRRLSLEDGRIYVEAGVPCAHLARFCAAYSLSGAEFFAGIPGTMGGALAMNAGAFGGETWDWVEEVETVDRFGCLRRRTRQDYAVGYRWVQGPVGEYFLAAWLRFEPGNGDVSKRRMRELLSRRSQTQPLGWPSAGSVFKNPPGDKAGRLIEACGLKGKQIGGARISDQHANFILNVAGAKAADIEALIHLAQAEVKSRFDIELVPEVKILGVEERG